MARISFLIFVGIVGMVSVNAQSSITFTLFGTAWTDCDATSDCDLFVKIFCSNNGGAWTECGRTGKQQGHNNPDWPEVFTFPHTIGTNQKWRFEVWEADVFFDDLLATHEVSVDFYNELPGNLYQLKSDTNTGILWIQRRR